MADWCFKDKTKPHCRWNQVALNVVSKFVIILNRYNDFFETLDVYPDTEADYMEKLRRLCEDLAVISRVAIGFKN